MVSEQMLIAAAALLGLLIVSATLLRGWQGWLALKERELDRGGRNEIEGGVSNGMHRIELADLKERIRKLEAIASGVDL
jgi:hypothetical protein